MENQALTKKEQKQCMDFLLVNPIFVGVAEEALRELVSLFSKKHVPKGTLVVRKGELVDSFYLIAQGKVEVKQENHIGNPVPVTVLQEGEPIGLSQTGFFSKTGKRTNDVEALSDMVVFEMKMEFFSHWANRYLGTSLMRQENAQKILRMNFLKQVAPFAELKVDQLELLSNQIKQMHVEKGKVIFRQGEQSEECYLIETGLIEIATENQKNEKVVLAQLQSPAVFGETALLLGTPRNATATAIDNSKLLVIDRNLFQNLLRSKDYVAQALTELVSLRDRPKKADGIEEHIVESHDKVQFVILKNPKTNQYYKLSPDGQFIWSKLDGQHTVRDITLSLFFERQLLNPQLVFNLILDLKKMGFVVSVLKEKVQAVQGKAKGMLAAFYKIKKLLEFSHVFNNVDNWLSKSYKSFFYIFYTIPAQLVMLALILLGFYHFVMLFPGKTLAIQQMRGSFWLLVINVPILMTMMVFHELAHAYTTKAFGKKVPGFGIGWFWLGPVAFCDTTDMWLGTKWQRFCVDMAGFYFQLVLAGFALLLVSLLPSDSYVSVFLWYFAVFGYLSIISNLYPVLEFDGYYALMDALNAYNLKESSVEWIVHVFPNIWKEPKKWLQYPQELIYWIVCILYLFFDFGFSYIVLKHFLFAFLSIDNSTLVLAIAVLWAVFPASSLVVAVRMEMQSTKTKPA